MKNWFCITTINQFKNKSGYCIKCICCIKQFKTHDGEFHFRTKKKTVKQHKKQKTKKWNQNVVVLFLIDSSRTFWLFIASEFGYIALLSLVCLLIVFSFSSLPNNEKTVVCNLIFYFAKNSTFPSKNHLVWHRYSPS